MESTRRFNTQANGKMSIIQQWQYLGRVHPALLEDKAFENCKRAGLSSVQSYVYWAEIEKQPDNIDFSVYDELVERLVKHDLGWVPFVILGPNYATPKWFQESEQSLYARCLEHGKESKIQSIWNPHLPKWVDRFLRLFAEHYRDCYILESITLGISGNWGEAIYPATGGFYGGFHAHPGYWCGDNYARDNFRRFAIKKYKTLEELNSAWDTDFCKVEEIRFPSVRKLSRLEFIRYILGKLPVRIKTSIKAIGRNFLEIHSDKGLNKPSELRRWIDFIEWYLGSMTDWAEFWVKTARKYLPYTDIYLVTGGDGRPILGADFSAQTKVVAKYNSGIRITNLTDEYGESFTLSRLVSSASRFYGAYFTSEEARINSPKAITMRVFDLATSGAKGAYFKSIIGTGKDPCRGGVFPVGEPTPGATSLARSLTGLPFLKSTVEVAVLLSTASVMFDSVVLDRIYNQCSKLRDFLDFDFIDDRIISDGGLRSYRFLIILAGNLVFNQTISHIETWVEAGGILILSKSIELYPVGDKNKISGKLFPQTKSVEKIGCGFIIFFNGRKAKFLDFISEAVYNPQNKYLHRGITRIDGAFDGVFASRSANKILYYNSNDYKIRKRISLSNADFSKEFEINLKANSITEIDLCES